MSAGFELRIYRCPGPEHLRRLNVQLGGDGLEMFARHGIAVLDAWTVALGAGTPVLLYLCRFDSLAARDAGWGAVDADAGWQEAKRRHSEGIGALTSSLEFWWLRAVTPLELPAGAGAPADLVTAAGPTGSPSGEFIVQYGPAGSRLAISPDGTGSPEAAGIRRRVRLKRVAWSPAAGSGVTAAQSLTGASA
jgi:hypothetical protein